ncbi:uncharacterized protein LOC141714097 [Apium graveolens]|uniref:uncharacterized protein LOC141714097 n=1 Tax=Apium graveolens TaxID=4045 RepID=UPI003D7BA103
MREFTKLGGIVKWPVKSNKPKANPDSKLWYDYHGDYGHKAYDCVALRKELQFLTRKGYLTEFMATKKTSYVGKNVSPRRNDATPLRQPPPPPHHKVINFISGGPEIYGSTYSQAKRASRETDIRVTQVGIGNGNFPSLMFDESDKKDIREPQQDELVISLPMGNCLIKRILVDNGSAANIMMLSTLTQMGLAESDMIKKSTILVGFSGETKRTLGEITLPTYAQGVNLLEKFCIIDVDSSYNIIMGRPWIHNLKVVPSTYHQGNKTPVATVTGPGQLAEVDLTTGDKKVLIGEDLTPTIEANLISFLTMRLDAFA